MLDNTAPLVSIAVISYNSEKTIIETLESIKSQTYKNIELIISDDFSSDNTLNIAKSWINNNKSRFVNTIILEAIKNTGVTANCNRAYKSASGIFIKDIAADDILTKYYTEDCVNYFTENQNVNVLYTKVKYFIDTPTEIIEKEHDYSFFYIDSLEQQLKYLEKYGCPTIPTPSVIYRLSFIKNIGYFDERIPMWEDGPITCRIIESMEKLYLLDKYDVLIRIRKNSLSNGVSVSHLKSQALYYKYYREQYDYSLIKKLYHKLKMFIFYHSNIKILYKLSEILY